MRTRFLNINYFTPEPKTLNLTNNVPISLPLLPVPKISSNNSNNNPTTQFLEEFLDDSVSNNIYEETEPTFLPIDKPLSLFLNQILPHRIDDSSNLNSFQQEEDHVSDNLILFPDCVAEAELNLDFRSAVPYPCTLSESIYLVEDITPLDFQIDEKRSYCISSTLNSTDAGLVILDFVYSEESPDGLLAFQDEEKLKEPFSDFGPTNLMEDAGQNPVMSKPGTSEKVPTLSDSMLNFNDLSLILNPPSRKSVVKKKAEPALKDTTSFDMQKRNIPESTASLWEDIIQSQSFQNVDDHGQEFEGRVVIVPLKEDSIPTKSYECASEPGKLKEPFGDFGSTNLMEDAGQKPIRSRPGTSKKVPTLSDSMSNFDDLSFFLNPRKTSAKQITEPAVTDTTSYTYDMQKRSKQEEDIIRLMSFQKVDDIWQKFEGLVDIVPLKEDNIPVKSYERASTKSSSSVTLPASDIPESKKLHLKMPSFSGFIVIVNTQNFVKGMLMSRRSSYQKILIMEKRGVQVVEREIDYPVDLILSARMCLVWYDSKSIGNKAMNTIEASSFVSVFVENIATNVLPSLRLAFSDCVLVFEGDRRYLTAIMESSDGLYASAASLGIHLQLFCAYSSELTDEIVMSCIDYSLKLNKSQYPKMPDTETLAESFLTRFPSIHPLSAHAILSSGGLLVEFLGHSPDHRIRAIEKCHIPNLSVSLFSSLCNFGEHEGSISGTTDCYSVSPTSESNSRLRTETQIKRQKCVADPQTLSIPTEGNFLLEPLIQSNEMNLKPPRAPQPIHSLKSSKHQKMDENVMSGFHPAEKIFSQKQSLNALSTNNSEWNQILTSSLGEVIDLSESSMVGEDIFSPAETQNFSKKVPSRGNDHAIGNLGVARRLSFGLNDFPDFPSYAEMNPESDMRTSVKDHKRRLEDLDSIEHPLSFNTKSSMAGEDFFSSAETQIFSKKVPSRENVRAIGNSSVARKFSFGLNNFPDFPSSVEIDSESDMWTSRKAHKRRTEDMDSTENPLSFNTQSPMVGEDFFSSADTQKFSKKVPSRRNDVAVGNSSVARRLSFGLNDFPDLSSSAEMNSVSDMWTSVKDCKRRFEDMDSIEDPLSYNTGRESFEKQNLSASSGNAHGSSEENNLRFYASKPFYNAFNSSRHQQGSPWTEEFLSKIKEKSKMRQKSLDCQMTKLKSLSIIDSYKYDGGSKSKKITNQKLQKRPTHQPVSALKTVNASSSVLRTWTPINKRARQAQKIIQEISNSGF